MKHVLLIILAGIVLCRTDAQAQENSGATIPRAEVILPPGARLDTIHDILLSPWGPYSKRYAGISHIPDMRKGLRFDFSVLPGLDRSSMVVPNVLMRSGYYPWAVNDDLTRYTYRYELEWKDRTYVDVTYSVLDSSTVLAAMRCVNATALAQAFSLNLMAYVDYPENAPDSALAPLKNAEWTNALNYDTLMFARPRPTDNLVNNGWLQGEARDSGYLDGRAVTGHFGMDKGDRLVYRWGTGTASPAGTATSAGAISPAGTLCLRYRMKAGSRVLLRLNGLTDQTVALEGTGAFEWKKVPYRRGASAVPTLTMISEGGAELTLNGILATSDSAAGLPALVALHRNLVPQKTENNAARTLLLKYADAPCYYGIAWDTADFEVREVRNDQLDVFFRKLVSYQGVKVFDGNRQGDYSNVCLGPLTIGPGKEKTVYAVLCSGSFDQVSKGLSGLNAWKERVQRTAASAEGGPPGDILPQGRKYLLARQLLKSTLMTNIVYPTYTQNSYIRHFTPGKWWNSIYTWDLGFIALGLNEINPVLAAECINAYTTPAGSQSAFVLHGTPLPVQIYAFYDWWNKYHSVQALQYFYPRLKRYYDFLSGRSGRSGTRRLKSNLLTTWDYFYNSGGWDDYPPQVAVHLGKKEAEVAPVVSTAHVIRAARMLRMAALYLHKKADANLYEADIRMFSAALQRYSWDSASGYFSYVVHDAQGNPTGHFTAPGGADYNMGLDGASPLVSGICTPAQQESLIGKLFTPGRIWSAAGLSTVDQTAPYFKKDNYWNGSVWMPHQWFMWKAMLDIDRPDLAFRIAHQALEVYEREAEATYCTFEHFSTETARGSGWHQFSGLSSPVLSWFSAYYRIGAVTPGYEIWINSQRFNGDTSTYTATLSFDNATGSHARSMIVCLRPGYVYQAELSGRAIPLDSPYGGLLQLHFPSDARDGILTIKSTHS
jgi:hypothetical protein